VDEQLVAAADDREREHPDATRHPGVA
jgi:hypothetical protein